jgi:hypothetical protein
MARTADLRRSLGWQLLDFIETFLIHGPGDVQGEPIAHDDEEALFLASAYALDPAGRRLYDEAFLSRPKGRRKSEIAGELVVVEFVGPARFSHFAARGETSWWGYQYDEGEPVGKPVTSPFIRCMATEEGQSGNTYDNVTYMLEHLVEHYGDSFPGVDLGQSAQKSTRVYLKGGGEIRPSTSSNAAKDGGKETFVVFDETHLYVTPTLRDMYDTVARNGLKRKIAQPWLMQTSTMYGVGEDSVAERTHRNRAKLPKLLFDHKAARDGLDPSSAEDRITGLRDSYGPAAEWMPIEDIAASYDDPRKDTSDWIRYFWNRPVAGTADLVDANRWNALARTDERLEPKVKVALGFDGARSDDSTALWASRISDGRLFKIGLWERPKGAKPGWRVDRVAVDQAVSDAFTAYDVAMMFMDPYKWESYADLWQAKWPKRVFEEPTNSERRFDADIRLFLQLVKDGALTHDGDADLARHIANAALAKGKRRAAHEDDGDDVLARNYLHIIKKRSGKIDASIAAVLAVAARGEAIENGALIDDKPFFAARRGR